MKRGSLQRIVTLALAVLDGAAYRSRTHRADTAAVRLALAILWCMVQDWAGLSEFWQQAQQDGAANPWEGCRRSYYRIAAACREAGWQAPVDGPRSLDRPGDRPGGDRT